MAVSFSIEPSELLENSQWYSSEDAVASKKENICDELADAMIYGVLMANHLMDIKEIIHQKIEKNNEKNLLQKYMAGKKNTPNGKG